MFYPCPLCCLPSPGITPFLPRQESQPFPTTHHQQKSTHGPLGSDGHCRPTCPTASHIDSQGHTADVSVSAYDFLQGNSQAPYVKPPHTWGLVQGSPRVSSCAHYTEQKHDENKHGGCMIHRLGQDAGMLHSGGWASSLLSLQTRWGIHLAVGDGRLE